MDGRLTLPEPDGFPEETSPEFAIHRDYVHDGRWLVDIGGFLVRTKDRLILVDAGSGRGDGEIYRPKPFESLSEVDPFLIEHAKSLGFKSDLEIADFLRQRMKTDIRTGMFVKSLRETGFHRKDVTDVVLSHLHFDHIGWVSDGGKPYFPNATVRCEEHDVPYFLDPTRSDAFFRVMWNATATADRMSPVLDRLATWNEDYSIAPGVDAVFTPGHTPGSSIFALRSGSEQLLILGDAVHCPYELVDPTFTPSSNLDAESASESLKKIVKLATSQPGYVTSPHFIGLRFGRLYMSDRPNRWCFEWK
jgi:glyoxylase-like metal-dependent hydrolase (beta-lactamase superfamily II)